jgi:hypothetical protein
MTADNAVPVRFQKGRDQLHDGGVIINHGDQREAG